MNPLSSPYCLISLALDAGNGAFMDHVAALPNLNRACRRVVANCGASGVDGMTVHQLASAWPQLRLKIQRQLLDETYAPAPIRRHAVLKPGGGVRVLGIPTVLDRVVQQALAQPLSALVDDSFSPFSFGFRPGRSAHDALQQAARHLEGGLSWVLHLDLEKFFDRAPHLPVLARLRERVADLRVACLAARFLSAPFACGGRLKPRSQGLPQGGPLSPLLANLLLDPLDRRLHDAGFAFCRYADDICLFLETAAEAHEALAMITPWIEADLGLRLNRKKTCIVPAGHVEFLGHRLGWRRGRVIFAPSSGACRRLCQAMRRLLARNRTGNPREVIGRAVVPLLQGWAAYFHLADDRQVFVALDRWAVRALRRWLWLRVRDPRRRARVLIRHGVRAPVAWALVATRQSPESAVCSTICAQAFPLAWLQERGWAACTAAPAAPAPCSPDDGAAHEIPAALRIAARECDFYDRLV